MPTENEWLQVLWERVKGYVEAYVEEYDSLSVATTASKGLVIPDGVTIHVDENGVISGSSSANVAIATTSVAGKVKPDGVTIYVDGDGVISSPAADGVGLTGASATIDGGTGTPSVAVSIDQTHGRVLSFAFSNLKGAKGDKGDIGPQGPQGAAGGIVGATASVDSGTGTPSVTVTPGGTSVNRTLSFAFSNLKGAKGDTGSQGPQGVAGEIVGATASVDSNTGTPSVTVSSGGTSTARTLDFAFSNLKGDKGDTGSQGEQGIQGPQGASGEIVGATASVDSGTGTPSVTVTLGGTSTARTFDFAFSNLKGEKGDTGSQGPQGAQGPQGPSGYVLTNEDKASIATLVRQGMTNGDLAVW